MSISCVQMEKLITLNHSDPPRRNPVHSSGTKTRRVCDVTKSPVAKNSCPKRCTRNPMVLTSQQAACLEFCPMTFLYCCFSWLAYSHNHMNIVGISLHKQHQSMP